MAKKVCDFCGYYMSTDMRFGVNLCDNCLTYYNSPDLGNFINNLSFEKATPAAKQLFQEKVTMNMSREERNNTLNALTQEELRRRQEEELRRQEELRRWQEEERRRQEIEIMQTQARIEQQKIDQEAMDFFLKQNGHEGYYEYKVLNVYDQKGGIINSEQIMAQLNYFGRQGWHLRCAFTNELGRNSSSVGLGGFSVGTNSTIDQSVLILERFLKF